MRNLTVHLVQANLVWEDVSANLQHLEELIKTIPVDAGIVVLPEMFATGFTMQPEKFAQSMDGEAVQWMQRMSAGRAVCGSLSVQENGRYYNRFIWVENGELKHFYDKRHLFSHGDEPNQYTQGYAHAQIEYMDWKIMPLICYDLRFPVWCRNTAGAHLQLFVANWPTVRILAWEKLLQARAIENQCYVAGANRVGADGNGIEHNGNSMVCSPKGDILLKETGFETIITHELNADELLQFRNQFPVLKDADHFIIDHEIPGY